MILKLLVDHPAGAYGLQLVEASDGALKRGTVYVTLSRMEDKGLIKSRVPEEWKQPGLPRPLYVIEALGRRALDALELLGVLQERI